MWNAVYNIQQIFLIRIKRNKIIPTELLWTTTLDIGSAAYHPFFSAYICIRMAWSSAQLETYVLILPSIGGSYLK